MSSELLQIADVVRSAFRYSANLLVLQITAPVIGMKRLARMPTKEDLWRAVLLGMLGGACLTQLLALAFR